ncbi:adenylyltransferase/cytidyltransferase family protein [Paenibacillus xylanexedens]|uniref:Cytidyltransferase-like protein n=1 Tax=Paenibacillus xylanexedens TaxID=528191 RepID=A0ABS4RUF1_PAEXY|nr:adenylyltransferase/cytidyltransferase family protein [Paenibacillus xylanexedens]MBP2246498.1 cytidyltransferase-like protein [Paenibacillus xylanexedens]
MTNGIPHPLNEIDADIGAYIHSHPDNNFIDVIRKDQRLEVSRYLSDIPNSLFAWYPFESTSNVLVIGGSFGAFLMSICRRTQNNIVVEKDGYRAHFLQKRMKDVNNLSVIHSDVIEFQKNSEQLFDYIIWAIDESVDRLCEKDYEIYFSAMKSMLSPKGKVLAVIPNRMGARFFCGERDTQSGLPFEGITDNHSDMHRFTRSELLNFLENIHFNSIKLYYPFPDYRNPQLIYTDDYPPTEDISERIKSYISKNEERVLSEKTLYRKLAQNNVLTSFSNYFIVECGSDVKNTNILYSALSSERNRNRSFATVISSDNKVRKIPIYDEGISGLEELKRNAEEQIKRNIPSLNITMENGMAVMDKIEAPTLSNYLRKLIKDQDTQAIFDYLDVLYKHILNSSDYTSENSFSSMAPNENWGPILKKAYIEMIPVNCFFLDGELLFFDQEYTMNHCPAGYVMFRAVHDIYNFIPEIVKLIPLEEMQEKYELKSLWKYYLKTEGELSRKIVNKDIYTGRSTWMNDSEYILRSNRRTMKLSSDRSIKLFDPVSGLNDRKLVLFGSGKYADYFIDKYGEQYKIEFIMDNNQDVWDTVKRGIVINSPDEASRLIYGTYRIVIAVANYQPIVEQLNAMGIYEDSYRIYQKSMDDLLPFTIADTQSDGKFNIGYVTGAFDLFHIGHLNLLKRCKERSHYLIAGVLTDEIIENEKNKTPFIPFEERIEIVKQCKYVDRVIPIEKNNTNKIDAWKELRYGCLFSGSDHELHWTRLQTQLRSLGSELEFFPYTQSTSSSMLQKAIREQIAGQTPS